jgi:LmbE family N-acetylglucosaminyl deacetylase
MREPRSDLLAHALSGGRVGPVLLVCAHPDDETLFATSVLLRQARDLFVLHLTDGAPDDPQARAPGRDDRTAYAAERQRELARAFDILGLSPRQHASMDIVDQCLVFRLSTAVLTLCDVLRERAPSIVFTHAYEGGHPDHDAAALAVKLALTQARELGTREPGARRPVHAEFASYHARTSRVRVRGMPKRLVPMRFNHAIAARVRRVSLTPYERELKRAALACFASQANVIRQFPIDEERYRLAPAYDFTRPPSASVMYEQWWGHWMDARRWCRVASPLTKLPRSDENPLAPARGGERDGVRGAPALGTLSRIPIDAHHRQRRLPARAGRT